MLAEDYRLGYSALHLIALVIEETGYEAWLKRSRERFMDRWRNIETLRQIAQDNSDLIAFLQNAALMSDVDAADPGRVRLSTLHAAKGLEFDWVFAPAFEERSEERRVGQECGRTCRTRG